MGRDGAMNKKRFYLLKLRAFTLTELVIIISLLAILSAITIPRVGNFITNAKVAATKEEMQNLKKAMVGDPRLVSSGQYSYGGYMNDVGELPPNFAALISKPSGVSDWDKFTKSGWRGPYIERGIDNAYRKDAWGNNYIYNKTRNFLRSRGPDGVRGTADDIRIQLLK